MKIVLIIGGAGFIGSNLAKRLADRGDYRVVIVDRFGDGSKWNNLVRIPIDEIVAPEQIFHWLDVYSEDLEAIFHLGGVSSTTESNVESIIESNHNYPLALWRWCATSNVRFICASSAEVYGAGEHGFEDTPNLSYQNKLRPLNPNGWSKKMLDLHMMGAKKREEKTPPQWVSLRFFNLFGPNEYHKGDHRSVALKLYDEASKNLPVKLFKSENSEYPDGSQLRDFMYIEDAVNMLEWCLDNRTISGLFNAGSGTSRSFEELAKTVFSALKKEPVIKYVHMPSHIEHQYQYKTVADIKRLRDAGYDRPIMTLEQGIETYIQRYLRTGDMYL